MRTLAIRKSYVPADINFYGKPNRPSTPIGEVVSEEYARLAQRHQQAKNDFHEHQILMQSKFRGVRNHTRASTMANVFVKSARINPEVN